MDPGSYRKEILNMMPSEEEILRSLSLREKASLAAGQKTFASASIDRLGLKGLSFSDGPIGIRKQNGLQDHLGLFHSARATCFPSPALLACSWDPKVTERIGECLGREAREAGVDVLLAPAMNMIRHPNTGRGLEYYSEDPYLTGILASAMTDGIQKHVSACPKHFLLNSQEANRMAVDEKASSLALYEYYLPAFEMVIEKSRPDWLMTSYNKVNGKFPAADRHLLQDVLRKQLGFDGAVVSDWGSAHNLIEGIEAGCSLEMPSRPGTADQIVSAVRFGQLKEEDLDARVLEVLRAMKKRDLRDESQRSNEPYSSAFHHKQATAAAVKSAVLLKNRNHILPLSRNMKTCWIGPFDRLPVQGRGSSEVNPSVSPSFKKLLREYAGKDAVCAEGYSVRDLKLNAEKARAAVQAARRSDVIIFLAAMDSQENMEGMDRVLKDLSRPASELINLLAGTGKPIVLVDTAPMPIELSCEKELAAVLYLGLAGQGSLEAMFELLYGKANPSGHLAMTWPANMDVLPANENFPSRNRDSLHTEELMVGYRYTDRYRVPVRYPFGYGLSYSEFACRLLSVDQNGVSFEVENLSGRSGSALIQMYVEPFYWNWNGRRPEKTLKGFQKIHLQPYQTKRGFIPFDRYTFRLWQPQSQRYEILKGTYRIILAWNSRDIIASREYYLKDGVEAAPETAAVLPVPNHQEAWELDLFSPLSAFEKAKNPAVRKLIRRLIRARQKADASYRTNTVLDALLDMPLASTIKLYPALVSEKKADSFIRMANAEAEADLKEWIRLFGTILKG